MPRRVFLHIGTPKSGTTYLQPVLPDCTTYVHPDQPPVGQVADAALEALAAVVRTIPAAEEDSSPVRLLARRLLRG